MFDRFGEWKDFYNKTEGKSAEKKNQKYLAEKYDDIMESAMTFKTRVKKMQKMITIVSAHFVR